MKKVLLYILDNFFGKYWYKNVSYSQDGEDMVLHNYYELDKKYKGFFIDIGAHHPFRFSNTARFYLKGWSGINVEPTPSLFKKFVRYRKRDINLNMGVANTKSELTFFEFNEGAYNTFDAQKVEHILAKSKVKLVRESRVPVNTLEAILEKYLPEGKHIDFITVDVEGLDFQVLSSNNWEKYRPRFLLVECYLDFTDLRKDKIYTYLTDLGYTLVAFTIRTAIFRDQHV